MTIFVLGSILAIAFAAFVTACFILPLSFCSGADISFSIACTSASITACSF
jgi:hypothetical protein